MKRTALAALCLCALAGARIIGVPDASFPTIQSGIDSALAGDTVLVEVNRWYENIDFGGRNIIVGSRFLLDSQLVWVAKTVIDGSRPAVPESASCVRIVNGEDSTTQLVGFTITGGTGTIWQDEHGAGLFREGGGILMQASAAVIRNCIITGNEATDATGCQSAGGGGIRAGDGNPLISHCVIDHNYGRYGAGIVLNYSGGTLRNCLIARNAGGEDYGGGGYWAYANGPAPKLIENCTFGENRSATLGGGMRVWATTNTVRNSIFWGNVAPTGPQIHPTSGAAGVTWTNVQGGRSGEGNIDADPDWDGGAMILFPASPCVDTGNPDPAYDDPDSAGIAIWPARGTERNDMGAYGGPGARPLGAAISGAVSERPAALPAPDPARPNPARDYIRIATDATPARVRFYDAAGRRLTLPCHNNGRELLADLRGLRAGVYLCRIAGRTGQNVRFVKID